jgi:predicted outer membrane lipoprotein
MGYFLWIGGITLLAVASAIIQAVLKVSAEMDERVDQMRKARE